MASRSAEPAADLAAYVPRLGAELARSGDEITVRLDATLACADLSGFTPLTERLAARGPEGAEAVTALVNDALAAFLGPALDSGGDVLYFGGDSATILFRGDDHAMLAATAAGEMQRALTAWGRDVADAPRLAVGLATGSVVAGVAGGTSRAVVVVGAAADATVELQNRARAGEVLASAHVATATPTLRWTTVDAATARLGWRARAAVRAPRLGVLVPAQLDDSWLPPALRGGVGREPGPGELRRASVAFLTARDLIADATLGRARAVVAAVEAGAARAGVCWLATDLCVGGLTFVLTAGAPVRSEHDEERIVVAVRSVLELAPPGSLRAGVERGLVFAGDIGHPKRRAWTVMGDSVNVAARLASAADPGEALAGPGLVQAAPHLFVGGADPGARRVKGRRASVIASRVPLTGSVLAPTGAEAGVLVGRAVEQARLAEAWADAQRGRGSAVDVAGDPGLGKSRLLAGLVAIATNGGAPATVVHPERYRASVPFAASAQLVRSVLGVGAADDVGAALVAVVRSQCAHLAPWLPLLADAADATVEPTDAVDRLEPDWVGRRRAGALVELLDALRTGPWLLAVEDLHWLDAASRQLLEEVVAAAVGRRWLVVAARRSESRPLAGSSALVLGPLDAAEARTVALAAALEPLADSDLDRIVTTAGGNPLFLEQLARHAREGDVPDSVERVLAARIDTLASRDRQLLRDASVVGRAPLEHVALLVEDDAAGTEDRWAALADFVAVDHNTVGFRNDLVRTVAYSGLTYRRRRALHTRMADLVRVGAGAGPLDDDTCGVLAAHLLEAGDADAAWPVAVDAARRAVGRVALVDAAGIYARAVAIAGRVAGLGAGALAAVHEERGVVCHHLGHFDEALASYTAAASLRDDAVDRARLCSRRAATEQQHGSLAAALGWGTRGLRLLDGRTDATAVAMRAQLAVDQAATRHYQGRNTEAVRWAEQGLADATEVGDDRLLAAAYLHLELAHTPLGDGLAAGYGAKAAEMFERIGDRKGLADSLVNNGLTAYNEGRWGEARADYERAAEVVAATGNVTQAAAVALNTAFLLAELGEIDEARLLAADAGRAFRAGGHEVFVGYVEWLGSKLASWDGDGEAAGELLAAARRRLEAHGARQMVLDCDVAAVECLLVAGRAADAVSAAEAVVAAIDAFGPAELLPATARRLHAIALVRAGRADAAAEVAATALDLARDLGARFEIALCLDAVAHAALARGERPAADALAERDAILEGLGVRSTLLPLAGVRVHLLASGHPGATPPSRPSRSSSTSCSSTASRPPTAATSTWCEPGALVTAPVTT